MNETDFYQEPFTGILLKVAHSTHSVLCETLVFVVVKFFNTKNTKFSQRTLCVEYAYRLNALDRLKNLFKLIKFASSVLPFCSDAYNIQINLISFLGLTAVIAGMK